MHLQESIEGFDVFARSLSIGAETMVMDFRPDQPMHDRYAVSHDFLSPETGDEVLTISRLINAFFRWEFNSCETLVRGAEAHPIDYANASPDVALTSLHYYFPWAMSALLRWAVFCTVTGRELARASTWTRARYFEIGDREDLTYDEKLAEYRKLADDYFEVERYQEFCATALAHVDELMLDWVASAEFDALLIETVKATYPEHEHEQLRGALPRAARAVGARARAVRRRPPDLGVHTPAAPGIFRTTTRLAAASVGGRAARSLAA